MWTRSISTRRSFVNTAVRRFSDVGGRGGGRGRGAMMDGRGGGRGGDGGRGGRGGRGRGGRGRGGRGRGGSFDRFRDSQSGGHPETGGKFHRGGPRKENFADKFLLPAAEGRLTGKHNSGIPKLSARKGKSNRVHDQFPGQEADEALDSDFLTASGHDLETNYIGGRDGGTDTSSASLLADSLKILNPDFIDDEDPYDPIDHQGFDPDTHPDVSKDSEGNIVLNYDPEYPDYVYVPGSESDAALDDLELEEEPWQGQGERDEIREVDPEEAFFDRDVFDFEAPRPEDLIPDEIANMLLPLKVEGPGLDGFLEATFDHPSKYAELRRYNHHPESLREPKHNFPNNRVQPSEDFVTSHMRFLFVSGLPHFVDSEGELGDLENPIHRLEVSKVVSEMLGVKTGSISPASMTSAFVGYEKKEDLYKFFKQGPKYSTVDRPLKISAYTVEEGDGSGFLADEAVVKLEDVPAGVSLAKLSHLIFPAGSEIGAIYGPLAIDDIKQLTPTSILVRMKSKEQVESALSSSLVQERLATLGHYEAQFFRARRELHHHGYTGPNKGQSYKRQGMRLVVDIDTPSKEFFQCHAGVIQLRNIATSMTKEDISTHFEPMSEDRRDVTGSVEFATCSQNKRTDIVYVGFERFGEAEAVVKGCNGLMNLGKGPVTARIVKEKFHPEVAAAIREARPERSAEELLESVNWENFVDPKEVKELEALGIRKEVLADAFHSMRYHNQSYGSLDWGLRSEKLDPDLTEPGQQMRDTMQLYIDSLKVVGGSPDITYADIMTFPEEEQESDDIDGADIAAQDDKQVAAIAQLRKSYFTEH